MLFVPMKIIKMNRKQEIRARLEWITKRLQRLEKRLYEIDPAKENDLFKRHSNERWSLVYERERLLNELDKLW